MSAISAAAVKELRQRTGLGVMTCKQALLETDGDAEKAVEWLRRHSGLKAASKSGRVTSEGAVLAHVAEDRSFGALIEVNCETDFVARDRNFLDFCERVLAAAANMHEEDPQQVLQGVLEERRQELVQKVGENVSLRRIAVLTVPEAQVSAYMHGNSRLAALAAIQGGDEQLARDVAMHIAASAPQALQPEDVPQEIVERERRLYRDQAAQEGKPPEIVEKMVAGRINKFLAEQSLLQQPFVRDAEISVGELLQRGGARALGFARYAVGEALEPGESEGGES